MLVGTSLGTFIDDAGLRETIAPELAATDRSLSLAARSGYRLIDAALRHQQQIAGRELRYVLVLLAARYGPSADRDPEPRPDGHVTTAAVVCELNHLATLHHERILERPAPAVGASGIRAANGVEILAGDHLFTAAARLTIRLGLGAVKLQSATAARLVTGQLREVLGGSAGSVSRYLSVAADKTGALTATCAGLGALAGGADDDVITTMLEFGERIGVAHRLAEELVALAEAGPDSAARPADGLAANLAATEPAIEWSEIVGVLRRERDEQVSGALRALDRTPDVPARKLLADLSESLRGGC